MELHTFLIPRLLAGLSLLTLHNLVPRGIADYVYLRSKSLQSLFNQGMQHERPSSIDLAHQLGLEIKKVEVTTDDGYTLTVFRCHKAETLIDSNKAVLVVHALLQSSNSFLLHVHNRNESLVSMLAEHGYTVYLANCRGNEYAQRHLTLDVNSQKFWEATYLTDHVLDITNTLQRVYEDNNHNKVHVVGFSQGAYLLATALSLDKELQAKVKTVTLLAPPLQPRGLQTSILSSLIQRFPSSVPFLFGDFRKRALSCVYHWQSILHIKTFVVLTTLAMRYLFGWSSLNMSRERKEVLFHHIWSVAGVNLVKDWLTMSSVAVRDHKYDLKQLKVPVGLLMGSADTLIESNMEKLASMFPNVKYQKMVEGYEHLDMIWADSAHQQVFLPIVENMLR